jgi:hypothetical protein
MGYSEVFPGSGASVPPLAQVESVPVADLKLREQPRIPHRHHGRRMLLLCDPAQLGYTFTPLSVYFRYRASGELGAPDL